MRVATNILSNQHPLGADWRIRPQFVEAFGCKMGFPHEEDPRHNSQPLTLFWLFTVVPAMAPHGISSTARLLSTSRPCIIGLRRSIESAESVQSAIDSACHAVNDKDYRPGH
ncbi:hypothetical protein J1614_006817 [Plenodomus biglobosus]|nr:hypothetical protein J1614_006817 [Plenodomus biglobosus]